MSLREFLCGASGTCEIPDFPAPGETARFKWNQSTQHLELEAVNSAPQPAQGKLYRTASTGTGWEGIQRANLDGSQVETLVSLAIQSRKGGGNVHDFLLVRE